MGNQTQVEQLKECFTCNKAGKPNVVIFTQKPWVVMPSKPELEQLYGKDIADKVNGKFLFFEDEACKIPHIHVARQEGKKEYSGSSQQWNVTELKLAYSEAELNDLLKQGYRLFGKNFDEASKIINNIIVFALAKFKPIG